MLTEEEAKGKKCCNPDSFKQVQDWGGWCIASQCMAWRWRRRYADDAKEAKISHVTGFCGLAGKP